MKSLILAATAVGALACASSAGAGVLTFEEFAVGQKATGNYQGSAYPFLFANGTIVAGPTGNALRVDPEVGREHVFFYLRDRFTGQYTEETHSKIVYRPFLKSFDYFVPDDANISFWVTPTTPLVSGQWATYDYNKQINGMTWRTYISSPYVLLDNFVFDDAYAAIPEPSTWALLIAGFGLSGAAIRSRRPRRSEVVA